MTPLWGLVWLLCGGLAAQVLPTGKEIRPVGSTFALDTFPVRAYVVPGRDLALILHNGFRPPVLSLLDTREGRVLTTLPIPDAGMDFAFDSRLNRVYLPGGHTAQVHVVELRDHVLVAMPSLVLRAQTGGPPTAAMVSAVSLSPDGKQLAVLLPMANAVLLVDPSTGLIRRRIQDIGRPTHLLFAPDAQALFVASARDNAVLRIGVADGVIQSRVGVAAGPSHLAWHANRLYVACANSNYVDVLAAPPGRPLTNAERLNFSFSPTYPNGISPTALAVDQTTGDLIVTLSDANAIARVPLGEPGIAPKLIPAGWYPTHALPVSNGRLLVLNGKGFRSYPNPQGPNPLLHSSMTPQPPSEIQYIGLIQKGGGQLVDAPDGAAQEQWNKAVLECNRALPEPPSAEPPSGNPIPSKGGASPLRHVVYIMKENRTYDQVLGDMEIGNGDPSLCIFPQHVSPNHHKLAREFTLFDNFYVNADVSSEGWHWSSAAIVPHLLMRTWPMAYAGRTRLLTNAAVTAEGGADGGEDAFRIPPSGYFWNRALDAGLSFRNFGFFVRNRAGVRPGEPIIESISDPSLIPHTNPFYAGYDPDFPDVERARIFLKELREWESTGNMPQLIVMVLPNDHTWGTAPGKLTPFASMADNDLALGQIVEAISRSRFWKETAIFVLEDDAQNGPDHVDAHRSPAYIISPYTRRGFVDSNFYNTTSMLRTMGRILGLEPLTHYDAFAPLMHAPFQSRPDLRPYSHVIPDIDRDAKNPVRSRTATRSERLDLNVVDAIDELEMNDILWLAIKGTPAPAPVRSVFW
ncbi:MAG: hypothetical protein MUF01_03260 [Bryobacterales bacterium]|nr:hypothetical protein [Bryobacterales bacterium]